MEALIEYVALFQQGERTVEARKQILIEQRDLLAARVEELQQTLNRLNRKIDNYEQLMLPAEQGLSQPKG